MGGGSGAGFLTGTGEAADGACSPWAALISPTAVSVTRPIAERNRADAGADHQYRRRLPGGSERMHTPFHAA